MAISKIRTLLPLDEYARIMAIPGWLFNQVTHPMRPVRGACDLVWLQSGSYSDPNRIVGRDELATAIAGAERKIADFLGFWPAPTWVQAEEHEWPYPERGIQRNIPFFKTGWGYLIAAGLEIYDLVTLYLAPILYSDEDFDGVLDTATITVTLPAGLYSDALCGRCELVLVPPGKDPAHREWRIRPLDIISPYAGAFTVTAPRWMFVDPNEHMDIVEIPLDEDAAFLNGVDVYCHYNQTTVRQAQYVWKNTNGCDPTVFCAEDCQNACVTVHRYRTGHFYAQPAAYSPAAGVWQTATWQHTGTVPQLLRIWYYAGYRDHVTGPCDWMGELLKMAIVRLTNIYLAEAPCGCGLTRERWESDREEQDINTLDVALAQSAFGVAAKGAVFAHSVLKTLPPLGQGG